jgi:predicted thioesterase
VSDELRPGLIGEARTTVDRSNVASTYGSGLIDVFSTPAMIGLMESAAKSAVDPLLPEGSITVGTLVNVKHLAATPIGLEVRATAELQEVDGRRLVFRVTAADANETIGEGTHERMIVDSARLLARAQSKAS